MKTLRLILAAALLTSAFAEDALPRIEELFGGKRAAADSVLMKDGSEVRGRIAESAVEIHTATGSIQVNRSLIAGIQFDAAPGHLDLLILENHNRITGFINQPLQLVTAAGTNAISKESARHVLFSSNDASATRDRDFAFLANGDVLSGRITLPAIRADTPSGARAIESGEVQTIRFEFSGQAVVQLRNGREIPARLDRSVRIAIGGDAGLNVPPGWIRNIVLNSDFLPAQLRAPANAADGSRSGPPEGFGTPAGMVWISPGKFVMGSPLGEAGRGSDEDPQTEVRISHGFWMGQREVTQGEYLAVIGSNPSNFQGDTNRPVEKVNWHEARAYCARLTEQARERGDLPPGYIYRLPTEAEWEYAARAGTTTRYSHGDDPTDASLHQYAWFIGNSDSSSQPVGRLKPNPWGLHDMHGNVWEWCLDLWAGSYPGGSVTDPVGATQGWLRVARGGSWLYNPDFCRSANRDDYGPEIRCSDIGFRVVLGPELLAPTVR